MLKRGYGVLLLIGFYALCAGQPALAQDDYEAGKTPPQLFATDCGICHKSPAGLAKDGGLFGLESFLRSHYTASPRSAAAIAAYLRAVDAEQAAQPGKRRKADGQAGTSASEKSGKTADGKTESGAVGKPSRHKAAARRETKPDEKPAETKASEPKTSDKGSDAKASGNRNSESKPEDAKPADTSAAKSGEKSN